MRAVECSKRLGDSMGEKQRWSQDADGERGERGEKDVKESRFSFGVQVTEPAGHSDVIEIRAGKKNNRLRGSAWLCRLERSP